MRNVAFLFLALSVQACRVDAGLVKASSAGSSTGSEEATSSLSSSSTAAASSTGGSTGNTVASSSGSSGATHTSTSTGTGSTASSSSGSSVTGFSSSSGATSTPASNVGCQSNPDAGSSEYLACSGNADCACPLSCQTDPAVLESTTVTVCLQACSSDSDCADSTSFCTDGVCRTRPCAFLNGTSANPPSDGGLFWGPCDAEGSGDGICLPTGAGAGDVIGVCQLTGSLAVGSTCSPLARRSEGPGAFCAPGMACLNAETTPFESSPPFTCQAVCDDRNPVDTCPGGQVCILSPLAGTMDGQLEFAGGEALYDVCTALGASGCSEAVPDFTTEWSACVGPGQCACDQHCDADPLTQTDLCTMPCTSSSDCADPATTCQGGSCWPVLCAGDAGLGATCNAAGNADGICLPGVNLPESLDPGQSFGEPQPECVQTGTAALGASCEPVEPTRANPSALCAAGSTCAATADGGGLCRGLCTYSRSGTQAECAMGEVCQLTFFDTAVTAGYLNVGACFSTGSSGCVEGWNQPPSSCTSNGDCPCPTTCHSGMCQ